MTDQSVADITRAVTAENMARADAVHAKYPLFDGHNDLPWAIRQGFDMKLSNVDLTVDNTDLVVKGIIYEKLHTDIPRLKKGGLGAQFWSVFAPATITGPEAVQVTLEQVRSAERAGEGWRVADEHPSLLTARCSKRAASPALYCSPF